MDAILTSTAPLIILGGFLIGFLVGITGVGAGALMTPFLITWIGVPPHVAVGTDLLFASLTKASAAWRHHALGNVDWRIVKWLAAGSLPGALAVLAWLHIASPDTKVVAAAIRQVLAAALVVSALALAFYPWLTRARRARDAAASEPPHRPRGTLVFGLLVGALVALTSVGAGAIGVAVLTALYPLLPARRVVGSDIVHAIPLAFVAGLGHLGMGNVDLHLLGVLLIGSVPGIMLGSRITGLLPDWLLRVLLAVVLSYAAYSLSMKG